MAYVSELLIANPKMTSFVELEEAVVDAARQGRDPSLHGHQAGVPRHAARLGSPARARLLPRGDDVVSDSVKTLVEDRSRPLRPPAPPRRRRLRKRHEAASGDDPRGRTLHDPRDRRSTAVDWATRCESGRKRPQAGLGRGPEFRPVEIWRLFSRNWMTGIDV